MSPIRRSRSLRLVSRHCRSPSLHQPALPSHWRTSPHHCLPSLPWPASPSHRHTPLHCHSPSHRCTSPHCSPSLQCTPPHRHSLSLRHSPTIEVQEMVDFYLQFHPCLLTTSFP